MATEFKRMSQLIGTTADWAANDIVLGNGEIGMELSAGVVRLKVGDGVKTFSSLDYATGFPVPGGGAEGETLRWDDTAGEWDRTSALSVVSGRVGVGTTTPTSLLTLVATGTAFANLELNGTPDTTASTWQVRAHDGLLDFRDTTAGATRVTFGDLGGITVGAPTDGDKGIGTVNVSGGLYVNGVQLAVKTAADWTALEARVTALEALHP